MNKDIRFACTCPDHPKTIKLMYLLGDRAFWCLTRLWTKVAQVRPSGNLDGMDEIDIEIHAGWQGEAGLFANTLVKLRLLDITDGTYCIHNWRKHNEYASRADERSESARKASNARWGGDSFGREGNKLCYSKDGMRPASKSQSPLRYVSKEQDFSSEPEEGLRLGKLLFELVKTKDPKAQCNMPRWAVEMERIIRLDKRTAEEIEAVILWAHADNFWSSVILSPRKLRERFTQIVAKMGGTTVTTTKGEGMSREQWKTRNKNVEVKQHQN